MSEGEKTPTSMGEAVPSEYVKVDSLKPRMRNVNVVVKVVSKGEPREITSRRDFSVHGVAEALVGDETGCILLNLWDEQIGKFDENDVIEIKNGYTSLFRGFMRLNIGRRGSAEKVDRKVTEINKKNNLSQIRHKSFSHWSAPMGRPYKRRRR